MYPAQLLKNEKPAGRLTFHSIGEQNLTNRGMTTGIRRMAHGARQKTVAAHRSIPVFLPSALRPSP
jgi:hypothetical protein